MLINNKLILTHNYTQIYLPYMVNDLLLPNDKTQDIRQDQHDH